MNIIKLISTANSLISFGGNISKFKQFCYFLSKKKEDYIVSKQYKKVVIYKNGHGIIENSFDFIINRPENFKYFYRSLNIEDGKTSSNFTDFKQMVNCNNEQRFDSFGIWFNSTNNFIQDVTEHYWSEDDVNNEDSKAKSNPKSLKFKFNVNSSKIFENNLNNLTYTVSVPGLYPITDYKYNSSEANVNLNEFSSIIKVKYNILSIKYVIGFESGFEFNMEPQCTITKTRSGHKNKTSNIRCKIRNNNFYTYYEFYLTKLKYNDIIKITWRLKP